MAHSEALRYGFEWPGEKGSCRIQVTRIASIKRSNGVYRILNVKTPIAQVNLYISPTGRIRIFDGQGGEFKLGT